MEYLCFLYKITILLLLTNEKIQLYKKSFFLVIGRARLIRLYNYYLSLFYVDYMCMYNDFYYSYLVFI